MSKVRTRTASSSAGSGNKGNTPPIPSMPTQLPFERMNYILLAACALVIALGFFLMSGDKFIDASKFSMSLHVAPIVIVAGFIGVIFAIMYTPKKQQEETTNNE